MHLKLLSLTLLAAGTCLAQLTIDRMTVHPIGGYSLALQQAGDHVQLFGFAHDYYLSDGSTWTNGAGQGSTAYADFLGATLVGNTITYNFSPISLFIGYQGSGHHEGETVFGNVDYSFGDHSASGELNYAGQIQLRATLGSNLATWGGLLKVAANSATWYGEPLFNYYSAPVGANVAFQMNYENLSGGWQLDSFNRYLAYNYTGFVDFTRGSLTTVPEPSAMALFALLPVLAAIGVRWSAKGKAARILHGAS